MVVDILDIERQYQLTMANIKLLQKNPSLHITGLHYCCYCSYLSRLRHSWLLMLAFALTTFFSDGVLFLGSLISAQDSVALLAEAGLFEASVSLAMLYNNFDNMMKTVIEVLTKKCLHFQLRATQQFARYTTLPFPSHHHRRCCCCLNCFC